MNPCNFCPSVILSFCLPIPCQILVKFLFGCFFFLMCLLRVLYHALSVVVIEMFHKTVLSESLSQNRVSGKVELGQRRGHSTDRSRKWHLAQLLCFLTSRFKDSNKLCIKVSIIKACYRLQTACRCGQREILLVGFHVIELLL